MKFIKNPNPIDFLKSKIQTIFSSKYRIQALKTPKSTIPPLQWIFGDFIYCVHYFFAGTEQIYLKMTFASVKIGFYKVKLNFFIDLFKVLEREKHGLLHIFYKQFHFPSQPGVAKEIWGNEAENCLAVAYVFGCFLHEIKENGHFKDLRLGSCLGVA